MNIPSRGKNHLFIGLVDKSKYQYENLGRNLFFKKKFQLFGKILRVRIIGMFGIQSLLKPMKMEYKWDRLAHMDVNVKVNLF